MPITGRQARVVSVRPHGQKLLVYEQVQDRLANCSFDAAQTLHLYGLQAQTWHFQKFAAETADHIVIRSHDDPHRCNAAGETDRATAFALLAFNIGLRLCAKMHCTEVEVRRSV
jgi:hypothetical protein